MRTPPKILIVDDEPANVDILQTRLEVHGYDIVTASNGEEALVQVSTDPPDLILLDVNMPVMDGHEVCRRVKGNPELPFIPVVMVTALADTKQVVEGLEIGADEYLTKPVDQAALVARVKSMLRIKSLHDTISHQTQVLQKQSGELVEWNQRLEERVQQQLEDLQRIGILKRFFSPQIVDAITSPGGEKMLESHRREITVAFCDLRGFTPFTENAEPETVMQVLREYHATMGRMIFEYEGTIEHFAGDGIMVFFNDPLPCEGHGLRAVQMALAMRQEMKGIIAGWDDRGHDLHFGVGIAQGPATLGMIGFDGRLEYGAVGPAVNLAARLSEKAKAGQILISQPVNDEIAVEVQTRPMGEIPLKGFQGRIPVYNVDANQ